MNMTSWQRGPGDVTTVKNSAQGDYSCMTQAARPSPTSLRGGRRCSRRTPPHGHTAGRRGRTLSQGSGLGRPAGRRRPLSSLQGSKVCHGPDKPGKRPSASRRSVALPTPGFGLQSCQVTNRVFLSH